MRPGAGTADDTSGRPSTGVLNDTYLPQYDLSIPIPEEQTGGRVRDLILPSEPPPDPWQLPPTLDPLPEAEEDDVETLILKNPN